VSVFSDEGYFRKEGENRKTVNPHGDVSKLMAAGKLVGMSIGRQCGSEIFLAPTVMEKLLVPYDPLVQPAESEYSVMAFVYGIYSVIPHDGFSRFFESVDQLDEIFLGRFV